MRRRCGDGVRTLNEDALKTALRRLRTEVFCAVMERDLAGDADVAEVTGAMTDLAELTIQRALAVLSADLEVLFGEPRGPDGERLTLGVVGMGKLGGRELNASSDIDLIFVYEEDGETAGGQRSPIATQEFFTASARRLIGALAEVTQDGYVFRVDMRLRPNGDSGPLVCSLGMLEEYFYVQGREWERYAWIKGRLVSEGESDSAQRLAEAARRDRDAVRLSPLSRLRRDRGDPLAASADSPGSAAARVDAPRQGRRHQARTRRHPRDRVQRAGVPVDSRRPGGGVSHSSDACRARARRLRTG